MKAKRNARLHDERDHCRSREAALAWVSLPYILFGQIWKLQPVEIFKLCEAQEKRFESINGKEFLESLDRMRLFGGPIFSEESESQARKAREFGFLIKRPRGSKPEWRYTELVRKLKQLRQSDLRWHLIARWLESEGVCKAEEFLPREVLNRLLTRARKTRLQVSASDLQAVRLVRIWLPYFERLLADREALRKKRRAGFTIKGLMTMGYVESAVESTYGKRESVQAAITWLTSRGERCAEDGIKDSTLRNAYSRVEAAKRKADAKSDKQLLRHPRQVEPWEYHNFLYLIS